MKKKKFLTKKRKQKIIDLVTNSLAAEPDVIFAYVFGSFINEESFRDIDIAVYVDDADTNPPLNKELFLERMLDAVVNMPIDVRVINRAPLAFAYNAMRLGRLILNRDNLRRADFESLTMRKYFDYQHLRDEYLREVTSAAI